ncbi:hypothetical protein [Filimonas effusa]|uniref:Uncharacterized protein n=1 Tax=Filimonas effusa TaxID=2508721 RepID=A0A4V1MA00_9BACT|nr:hypothetical protein [Filimonas effusa]RXK83444.1 hypothetical protein ESB13_15220 [Filimonas effusa]
MKRLKIISAEDLNSLESAVNQWLSDNKNITVLSADLKMAPGNKHVYHLLYTTGPTEEEGKLHALAVVEPGSVVTTEAGAVVEVITEASAPEKN